MLRPAGNPPDLRDMVNSLLTELEDHNCWTMAEAAGHPAPHRMQHLLSRARVDEGQMLDAAADWAAGHLYAGHDVYTGDVVLIVDETADEKSSDSCAGAACQYSGTVGRTALCQVAVTLALAAPDGHALIGRALYLPESWAADEERRELAGVPDEVTFKTKPQLAGDLLQHAHNQGIRAGFVAGDEAYGSRDLRKGHPRARHRLRPGRPLQLHGHPALRQSPHREEHCVATYPHRARLTARPGGPSRAWCPTVKYLQIDACASLPALNPVRRYWRISTSCYAACAGQQ
jgi:hypothetical protein